MKQEVKVVIGANYGDEGKGLVSSFLTKQAVDRGRKVLTVLYNGGAQRGHTANGRVHHCTGAGIDIGCDTFYGPRFMVDPIALWLSEAKVFIDPNCRIVVPHDVIANRIVEQVRGTERHGSCGMGIFQACKRNANPDQRLLAGDLFFSPIEITKQMIKKFDAIYGKPQDVVYNGTNFIEALKYMRKSCTCLTLEALKSEYQTVIFEGGQGLLLDQSNRGAFPHLTPSSTGARNTIGLIQLLNGQPDVYYVSRTYMTRHGRGPMKAECAMEDINPDIVDETNAPNQWQGKLRFGYLYPSGLEKRVQRDASAFDALGKKKINLVYTQANYTDGKLAVGKDRFVDIQKPSFVDRVWVSDEKDGMRKWL